MVKFFGILAVILLPLIIAALVIGRRLEQNGERAERDRAIREGMNALKDRVLSLEKLRGYRRERRG